MNNAQIIMVETAKLELNNFSNEIYVVDDKFVEFMTNISQYGILEPLVVSKDYVVISGNRRLKAASNLKIDKVPVIISDSTEQNNEMVVISHNQQRVKTPSQIFAEYQILKIKFPVKKGERTDLNNNNNNKIIINTLGITKTKLYKLDKIDEAAKKLHGSEAQKKVWEKLDNKSETINATYKNLTGKLKKNANAKKIAAPIPVDFKGKDVVIYNKSCETLSEIADLSVATIITSPPYFNMRNYGNGEKELGLEKSIESYVENLLNHFSDCKRVLKDDGSLWVNLNDCIVDKQYKLIQYQFALRMIQKGWILNDEIIWIKNNPTYSHGPRSLRTHENIFHFVKSENFYYDVEWVKEIKDDTNSFSCGRGSVGTKLKSSFNFRDNILITNAANNSALKHKCKEKGVRLTHSATFPVQVPAIAIFSTTKPGDTVLDIFNGTGTTGEVALEYGRKYIGYELNPEYIKVAEVRFDPYLETEDIIKKAA